MFNAVGTIFEEGPVLLAAVDWLTKFGPEIFTDPQTVLSMLDRVKTSYEINQILIQLNRLDTTTTQRIVLELAEQTKGYFQFEDCQTSPKYNNLVVAMVEFGVLVGGNFLDQLMGMYMDIIFKIHCRSFFLVMKSIFESGNDAVIRRIKDYAAGRFHDVTIDSRAKKFFENLLRDPEHYHQQYAVGDSAISVWKNERRNRVDVTPDQIRAAIIAVLSEPHTQQTQPPALL